MRNLAVWILALGIAAAPAVAADGPGSGTANGKAAANAADAKNSNSKDAANKAKPEDKTAKPSLEEEIDEMRAVLRDQALRLADQQREIEEMKAELARTNSTAA